MFLLAGLITVVFGFFVLRAIAREISALLANLPQYVDAFTSWLATLAADHPALQDLDVNAWLATNMPVVLSGLAGVLGSMLGVVGFATSLLGGFLTILFTVFMALYLTIDAARMRDYLAVFWPTERQGRVTRMANEMGARLGHWAIGQGILCVVIGGGAWLGLQLVGVPYAALLGLVWALAEFVPGIGPFLSAIPSIALGFSVSPATGLAAAIFSLVWSQLENNVITPKIMGNAVELHPLVILVALLVGAELLGAPGALLAIPVAATLAVVVDEIRHERMRGQVGLSTDSIVPDDAAPAAPPIR
jgi:predicted PurR-regulated permease PerM